MSPDLLKIARQWIVRAGHDLLAAERLAQATDEDLSDILCFHAQQAVEKYLKALLVFHKIDFPKTHDLTQLAKRLNPPERSLFFIDDLAELNPYAIATRYPGDWGPAKKEDASRALAIAFKVRTAIQRQEPSLFQS